MNDLKSNRMSLTSLTVNQFIIKNNIDPMEYVFTDFSDKYFRDNNIYVDYNIPFIEGRFFLGLTVRSLYSTCVFINPLANNKRSRNFSICHELAHCLFDLNYRIGEQEFFNFQNRDNMYTPEELIFEKLADGSAGIIMLPDIKLVHYFKTNKSYPLICDECQISHSALYNRLIDFGVYSCGMSELMAIRATKALQDSGDRSLFRMYLTGVNSDKEKQIIYKFQNAL